MANLEMIVQTNGSTPQTSFCASYFNASTYQPQGAIRGDTALAASIEPVTGPFPYVPDFETGDALFIELGLIDAPATAGTFNMGVLSSTIASVSTSGPYTITTTGPHYLASSCVVQIVGSTTTPSIDGNYVVATGSGDSLTLTGIPAVTMSGAGGYIYALAVSGPGTLTSLPFNISTSALQTAVNAVLSELQLPNCTVSQPEGIVGTYQFNGSANGALPANAFWADPTFLYPVSQWAYLVQQLGSSGSPFVVTITLKQAPFCWAQFSTALAAASITSSTIQSGSTTANQILGISTNGYSGAATLSLTAQSTIQIANNTAANPTVIQTNSAHGFSTGQTVNIPNNNGSNASIAGNQVVTVVDSTHFSIPVNCTSAGGTGGVVNSLSITATCGQLSPAMSAGQLGAILSNHPLVYYANASSSFPNNVIVTQISNQSWSIQFTGTLGNSTVPAITFPANTLVAPQGYSGTLSYNTTSLYVYSLSQSGNSFPVPLSIYRTRSSGQKNTIWGPSNFTINKDNLNAETVVPASLPGAVLFNPNTFQIINPNLAAFMSANMTEWLLSLPTSLVSSGNWWNNSGQPTYVS